MEKEEWCIMIFDPYDPVVVFKDSEDEALKVYDDFLEFRDKHYVMMMKIIKQEAPTNE